MPNTYFPAFAAIALDLFNREGLDVMYELIFPNYKAYHWATHTLAVLALSARDVV